MSNRKTTVLIVEDESIVAEDIETSLLELGYEVAAKTGSAKNAIELARKHRPDLVLMDIVLKGEQDGVHAAGQIASQFDIPVVFLTAYSDKSTLNRAKLTDPFGYITKPFQDKDLSIAIELALFKHQQQKVLKENRSRLDTTLKSIGDPVITTDKNCRVTFLNLAAQVLTGWSEDEIIGKPVQDIFKLKDPRTFEELVCPVTQAIETGNSVSLEGWFLLTRKDGSTLPVGDCIAPIKNERGDTLGAVLIFQNMTWHEKADLRSKRFIEELKRSNTELSTFAATASHDLQEPLRKVIAFGELLKQSAPDLDEQQEDYMERMRNATRRMQDFIRNLQEYSKVATTKTRAFETVDLRLVVSDVLASLETRIKYGARMDIGKLPVIEANRFRMEQLFLNLIGNALKFHTKDNIPEVRIESLWNPEGKWEITVKDNGIGFDEVHAQRIFEPFERLCGRSQYEGNGIGLSICKKIVENHKGHISVKSQPGKGSSFIVTLPEKQT